MSRERTSVGSALGLVLPALMAAALALSCGGSKTDTTASTGPAASSKPSEVAQTAPPAPAADANDPGKPATPASENDDHRYDPATAAGAVRGIPAPTNTASIEAVANFFTEIPGVDLDALDTHAREKFLHRVNSELCSCGCKNDTIAKCAVNDPKCPLVKTLVQKVYDEVKSGR